MRKYTPYMILAIGLLALAIDLLPNLKLPDSRAIAERQTGRDRLRRSSALTFAAVSVWSIRSSQSMA